MKKIFYFTLFILSVQLYSQENVQSFLIDFGTNDGTNGNITLSPDNNGNSWNNSIDATTAAQTVKLVNQKGESSNYNLNIIREMFTNGILNGGLLSPNYTLNDLATKTATQDYFFTNDSGKIILSGLNPNHSYKFKVFASRESTQERITKYLFKGKNEKIGFLKTSGLNIGGNGYNGNKNNTYLSEYIYPNNAGQIEIIISRNTGSFGYLNALKILEYSNIDNCDTIDKFKISILGSSVAKGVGADNLEGYAYQYTKLLNERYNDDIGKEWKVVNISISGNNTIDVLSRWENDLLNECGSYVVYGLSLGNEGIRYGGQSKFNQFRDNMILLIEKARERGIVPIVMNNYSRGDYDSEDYTYIKKINLLIHEWNVPSINLLGSNDNGNGNWVNNYWKDSYHPNNFGHLEFFYSIVPSLFDALEKKKPMPKFIDNTHLKMGPNHNYKELQFIPENITHSFTTSFDIKTSKKGKLLSIIKDDSEIGSIFIDDMNKIIYRTISENSIISNVLVNDNSWHKITLTHFYASKKTILYIDGIEQGLINQQIAIHKLLLNYINNNDTIEYRNWFFYRSGMNKEEILSLNNNTMLKSSLELYAPLDETIQDEEKSLINLAQSTNKISKSEASLSTHNIKNKEFKIELLNHPNKEELTIKFFNKINSNIEISVYNLAGSKLYHQKQNNLQTGSFNKTINTQNLKKGVYIIQLKINNNNIFKKFLKP
ncbi:GDSL-type esterase/lipase family protein [Polaribacter tangerinus]|uniref:GDSL-type esterase/lipase family protein n=1 Tax=Polaribacter tangerinus TaxID=1920034 RepID=UPI000B4A8385|nr:GDSL-type esterase/lipase family protein [Polaribacter tangerinus]